jgi:hypothetical protein
MSGKTTQGRRVYPADDTGVLRFAEGDYGQDPKTGRWYGRVPGGDLGDLTNHQITEHEDGTITVSPSILVYGGDGQGGYREAWHGFLERGVWRAV